MRISGGQARGVPLKVPPDTRPASERVRLAVFSSLAERVPDAHVLDLYCGSGAYGLEALSRGAADAVFVDADRRAVDAVRRNAEAAKLADGVRVHRRDVAAYLATAADEGPFDLVFCDPPYEASALGGVLVRLAGALAPDAVVVGEVRWSGETAPEADGYLLEDDRRYGDTRVLVYRLGGASEGKGPR